MDTAIQRTKAVNTGNLSPGAANKRVRAGIIALAIGLTLAVLLHRYQVGRAWMLVVFLPLFVSTNGFLQGLYRS